MANNLLTPPRGPLPPPDVLELRAEIRALILNMQQFSSLCAKEVLDFEQLDEPYRSEYQPKASSVVTAILQHAPRHHREVLLLDLALLGLSLTHAAYEIELANECVKLEQALAYVEQILRFVPVPCPLDAQSEPSAPAPE